MERHQEKKNQATQSNDQTGWKLFGMMGICCILPLVVISVLPLLAIESLPVSTAISFASYLICPIMMLVMMRMALKNNGCCDKDAVNRRKHGE